MSDTSERKVMTPAEREARKVFRAAEATKAMSEHELSQKAFHENRERLKAARLAREAVVAKPEAKTKTKTGVKTGVKTVSKTDAKT